MSLDPSVKKKASTSRKIKDAYIRLIWEKGFDKITVREVCDKADIFRSTFYTHFQSVYDLIEEIETELIDDMTFYRSGEGQTWKETKGGAPVPPLPSTKEYFLTVENRKEYLKALLSKNGDPYFRIRLRKRLEKDIDLLMSEEQIPKDSIRPYIREVFVDHVLKLTEYWISTEDDVDIDFICQLANIIRSGSNGIDFDRFKNK